MSIENMIEATIGKEGGYVNHPSDPGGETRWGITKRVARAHGYAGDMRSLPRDRAVAIYRQEYAIRPGFAAVAEISPTVGEELFDTGVNMGPTVPSRYFQRALNAFNLRGKVYGDIAVDGLIGPGTLAAFRAFIKHRGPEGERVMLRVLNAMQAVRYIELAEARPANEDFVYGWIRTRVA